MRRYPPAVAQLLYNFNGWLVGSTADPSKEITPESDFDILIPFNEWHKACLCIPKDAKRNSFGGWEFSVDGCEIDMWPGDLSWFCTLPAFKYAYNVRTETLIGRKTI
jgi:hypothetical protein